MRIAICDDEAVQRKLIISYLQEWRMVTCEEFSSAEQFLFQWEEDKAFDLLILDIEMSGISGMELAEKIRTQDDEIPILFITGYDEYMAQGYDVSAVSYLLKPLQKEKLLQVMDRIQKNMRAEEKLVFQTETSSWLVKPSDIWYVEADRHYCVMYAWQGMVISERLKHPFSEVCKILDKHNFFVQCHRSILVNLKHISTISRTEIMMDNGSKLPVSRSSYKAVNESFIRTYGLK